jgi:hypothetical protein
MNRLSLIDKATAEANIQASLIIENAKSEARLQVTSMNRLPLFSHHVTVFDQSYISPLVIYVREENDDQSRLRYEVLKVFICAVVLLMEV